MKGLFKICEGFTMIELLIVVSIIGILAALLIPALGNMQRSARETACVSNLHKMGTAVRLYAADGGGLMPYCWDTNISTAPWWFQQIMPYLDEPPPSNKYYPAIHTQVGLCPIGNKIYPSNSVGNYGFSQSIIGSNSQHLRASQVSGSTYMIADRTTAETHLNYANMADWHRGGLYMLYAGGQVEWLSRTNIDPAGTGHWLPAGH